MRIRILGTLCLLSCLALEVGCEVSSKKMKVHSDNPAIDRQKYRLIVYCWFVENNGAGRSGYAVIDEWDSRPLEPDARLFPTLEEVRHMLKNIKNRRGGNPVII